MQKKKINKVIVVEGRDDTANLQRFYEVETYETSGSALSDEDLSRLSRLQQTRGLIVFTDPDFQGERIRKMIMAAIPAAAHAFLQREEAAPKGKGSLGVEHASFEALERSLSAVSQPSATQGESKSALTQADMVDFGLVMRPDSRRRREFLCQQLRIGYANGKQILKRLNLFATRRDEIASVMRAYRPPTDQDMV